MMVVFLICTEPALEKKSVLLVRSIRRFAGSLSDSPVYSFAPRGGELISTWAMRQFASLGVVHNAEVLNPRYTQYGVNNKPFVCAYAESAIRADVLIFLDSDKIVFNEPNELLISSPYVAAARPVNLVNIGVRQLYGGKNEEYWRQLCILCGAEQLPCIRTTIDDTEIMQYFNSGMISTRPECGVYRRWADNFRKVMCAGIEPSEPFFIEQSVFAATVGSSGRDVLILPSNYNYPLPAHHGLPIARRVRSFDELVSVHYHKVFDHGNWQSFLKGLVLFEKGSLRCEWLIENLTELNC